MKENKVCVNAYDGNNTFPDFIRRVLVLEEQGQTEASAAGGEDQSSQSGKHSQCGYAAIAHPAVHFKTATQLDLIAWTRLVMINCTLALADLSRL
jgi:hypothetical protein